MLCRGAALRFMLTRLVDWLNVPPGALVQARRTRSNTTASSPSTAVSRAPPNTGSCA